MREIGIVLVMAVGIAGLFLIIVVPSWIDALLYPFWRKKAEAFWISFLVKHGPTPYLNIPRFRRYELPIERYRRKALIEIDRVDGMSIIYASGYAKLKHGLRPSA